MATVKHYNQEERANISDQIGSIFDFPNAGMKMTEHEWSLESWGDQFHLKVELVAIISREQAEAILNARPLDGEPNGK